MLLTTLGALASLQAWFMWRLRFSQPPPVTQIQKPLPCFELFLLQHQIPGMKICICLRELPQKVPQTWWLHMTEMYSLMALGVRSQSPCVCRAAFLRPRGTPSLVLPASDGSHFPCPWLLTAPLHPSSILSVPSLPCSPLPRFSCQDTCQHLGPPPPHLLLSSHPQVFNLITSGRALFTNKALSQIPESGTWTLVSGGQHSAHCRVYWHLVDWSLRIREHVPYFHFFTL